MTVQAGVQFSPISLGKASTTQAGKQIFASAVADHNLELSHQILIQNNWRKRYMDYIPLVVETSAKSEETAETMAELGLKESYEQFVFSRAGKTLALSEAMESYASNFFHTAVIRGNAPINLNVSVSHKGRRLSGLPLQEQIQIWIKSGIIEADHGDDILNMLDQKRDLNLSGRTFVLLGAGSEVGPLKTLLSLGATVIAVARNKPENWKRLIKLAESLSGTLLIPCFQDPQNKSHDDIAEIAGADLLTQAPEIAYWLNAFEQPLNLGSYAYLDGAKHVQVVMAMDAIAQYLLNRRSDITLSYLLTPSDVYCVSRNIAEYCEKKVKLKSASSLLAQTLNKIFGGLVYSPSVIKQVKDVMGRRGGILDNLVGQQGPNYVLAKHIQRWRAMDASKKGIPVSCNVAPASSTQSVTSNPFFAAAMTGSELFGVEVFTPDAVNALMALQMLSDLTANKEAIRGEALFIRGANHGGAWRIGYCFRSMLVLSLIVGFFKKFNPRTALNWMLKSNKKQSLEFS